MYKLYIKTNIDSAKLLDIVLKDNNIKKYSIFNTFTSISVMPFYLVCIVTTLLLYLIKI